MHRWDIRCQDGHIKEVAFVTYREAEESFREGIPCSECGKPTVRLVGDTPVIYNCPGFYGNVPTVLAHNTGQI